MNWVHQYCGFLGQFKTKHNFILSKRNTATLSPPKNKIITATIHYTPVVNNLQLLKGFSLHFVNMNEAIISVYKNKHHRTLDQAK